MFIPSSELLPPPFGWVAIPKGNVTVQAISSHEGGNGSYIPAGASRTFEVAPFEIAKYPITNAQFAKFVEAHGYDQPRWWTDEGWGEKVKNRWEEPRFWFDPKWNKSDYPVVGVSWYEAVAFCCWLNEVTGETISLPTEQQWQRAAQGDTNWRYAWGPDFDPTRCNWNMDINGRGSTGTTPVTKYEVLGDSPFGATDMNGNVWEYCLTGWFTGNNGLTGDEIRIARGGGWMLYYSYEVNIGSLDRMTLHPFHRSDYLDLHGDTGFRCVRAQSIP